MQDFAASSDPKPELPVRPSIEDCCQSGCTPCVFDLYGEAMERHYLQLRAWRARNAEPSPASDVSKT